MSCFRQFCCLSWGDTHKKGYEALYLWKLPLPVLENTRKSRHNTLWIIYEALKVGPDLRSYSACLSMQGSGLLVKSVEAIAAADSLGYSRRDQFQYEPETLS